MARAQKIVDRMLRPYIEQYERQQEEMERNHHKYYTTLPEIMVSSCNVTNQCRKLEINYYNYFSFPEGARQDQGTMEEGRSPEEAT